MAPTTPVNTINPDLLRQHLGLVDRVAAVAPAPKQWTELRQRFEAFTKLGTPQLSCTPSIPRTRRRSRNPLSRVSANSRPDLDWKRSSQLLVPKPAGWSRPGVLRRMVLGHAPARRGLAPEG